MPLHRAQADAACERSAFAPRQRLARPWSVVAPRLDAAALADHAAHLEVAGYEGLAAGQLHGAPWATLAACATRTRTLHLATGVALSSTRSVFETAQSAIELDRLCGGRFTLGLGLGNPTWNRLVHGGDGHTTDLASLIEALRSVWSWQASGDVKIIEIPGINLDLRGVPRLLSPVRDSIPVWLAALRPRVAEIAAKVADGVIGHPLWTQRWIDGVIAPRVDQALAAAGRDPDAFSVQLWVWAAPGGNEERSLHAARTIVDFYVRMPTHAEFFRAEGWGDEADRVAAEPGRPVDTIPAEMARHFVLLGSIDEVAAILRDRARHATSLCVAPPMTAGGSQMVESAVAIHEALHRADLLAPGAMT